MRALDDPSGESMLATQRQQVYSMVIHCNFVRNQRQRNLFPESAFVESLNTPKTGGGSPSFCYFWRGVRNKCGRFGLADTTKSGSFPPDLNILGSSVFLAKRGMMGA